MFALLKRVLGTSEEHKRADERYRKQLEELEKREEELEALSAQLQEVSEQQIEKKAELSKTGTDLTATLSRSLSRPPRKVTQDDQSTERPSGEFAPSHG